MAEQMKNAPGQESVSPSISNKLLDFQRKVSAIPKDSTNPFFNSKYFDINRVIAVLRPILNETGLTLIQPLGVQDGRNVIHTILLDGSEVVVQGTCYLPDLIKPQELGSAITYFRRYGIVSTLLLEGEEDDDGNKASSNGKKQQSRPATTAPAKEDDYAGAPGRVRPASDKQKEFIRSLLKQKGKEAADTKIEVLKSSEASEWIKRLESFPDAKASKGGLQIEKGDMPE